MTKMNLVYTFLLAGHLLTTITNATKDTDSNDSAVKYALGTPTVYISLTNNYDHPIRARVHQPTNATRQAGYEHANEDAWDRHRRRRDRIYRRLDVSAGVEGNVAGVGGGGMSTRVNQIDENETEEETRDAGHHNESHSANIAFEETRGWRESLDEEMPSYAPYVDGPKPSWTMPSPASCGHIIKLRIWLPSLERPDGDIWPANPAERNITERDIGHVGDTFHYTVTREGEVTRQETAMDIRIRQHQQQIEASAAIQRAERAVENEQRLLREQAFTDECMEILRVNELANLAPMLKNQGLWDRNEWCTINDTDDLKKRIESTPDCFDDAGTSKYTLTEKSKDRWWKMIAQIEYAKRNHLNLAEGDHVRYSDTQDEEDWCDGEVTEVCERYGPLIKRYNSSLPLRLGLYNFVKRSEYQPPTSFAKFKLQFASGEYVEKEGDSGNGGGGHGWMRYTDDETKAYTFQFVGNVNRGDKPLFYIESGNYEMDVDYSGHYGCMGVHDYSGSRKNGQLWNIKRDPNEPGYYKLQAYDGGRRGGWLTAFPNGEKESCLYLKDSGGWKGCSFRFKTVE